MSAASIVLTRFNCRFNAAWTAVAIDPSWLGPRFELFERYCLPSMQAQDCQDYRWVILFDEETPEPFKSKAEALAGDRIKPIFVGTLTGEKVRSIIRDNIPDGSTHVITSRLDNDDGVATDYVRRIREAFTPEPHRYYLNYPEGIILRDGGAYQRFDYHNAFVSLVEPVDGKVEGVWSRPHNEIQNHAPVVQLKGGPAWLQVIHESNVSNKVRGKRMLPSEFRGNFVLDQSELKTTNGMNLWWERSVMHPIWTTRDMCASGVRKALRMVGKGWKP